MRRRGSIAHEKQDLDGWSETPGMLIVASVIINITDQINNFS